VNAVSLSGRRYLVELEPVAAGVGKDVVIFVSPGAVIRRAIEGDQCEHYRLHHCPAV
jgi:hypothetical protein